MFEAEADLRKCGLRWKLDEDRCVIATARARRLRRDHLYFHGANKLGIYYERTTQAAATHAFQFWSRQVGANALPATQVGDFDGIVLFRATCREDVPRQFRKGKPKGIAKSGLSSTQEVDRESILSTEEVYRDAAAGKIPF